MKKIVLLRHGESLWNQENRFTGWTDVDLSQKGKEEAKKAGRLLLESDFLFEKSYASYLKRSIKTLNIVLDVLNQDWIPIEKSWRLNEKHYGILQGLNKHEIAEQYSEEQVFSWRRGYAVAAPPLSWNDKRHPHFDIRYKKVNPNALPATESLKDTIERILPYWQKEIFPSLEIMDHILIVAHGNSLRGIIKYLKQISDEEIVSLNLPTAVPYVFEFDSHLHLKNDYFLGDPQEIEKQIMAIANQGKKK